MQTARAAALKAVGAFGCAAVLGGALVWQVLDVWAGSGTVDQAPRLLIVVSTSGGDRPYEVAAQTRVDDGGDLSFVFYGRSAMLAEQWAYVPIDVEVAFASTGVDTPIACGPPGEHAAAAAFESLSAGAQYAVRVDLISERKSALNYRADAFEPDGDGDGDGGAPVAPAENPADAAPSPESAGYQVFTTTLGLLTETHHTTTRWPDDAQGVLWAEECTIPAEYVWRESKGSLFELAARKSFLMPQINVVSAAGDDLVNQAGLVADTTVARQPGLDALTSYPPFDVGYDGWSTTLTTQQSGTKLLFTDQPVLILEDRDAAQRKELVLLLYGTAAGAVGTLIVLAARNAVAALVSRP